MEQGYKTKLATTLASDGMDDVCVIRPEIIRELSDREWGLVEDLQESTYVTVNAEEYWDEVSNLVKYSIIKVAGTDNETLSVTLAHDHIIAPVTQG